MRFNDVLVPVWNKIYLNEPELKKVSGRSSTGFFSYTQH